MLLIRVSVRFLVSKASSLGNYSNLLAFHSCRQYNNHRLVHSCTSLLKSVNFKRRTTMVNPTASAGEPLPVEVVKEMVPPPDFIQHRIQLWDQFKAEYQDFLSKQVPQPIKITVTLKDGVGKEVSGESWKTTPYAIAREHGSKSYADSLVIGKVNGVLWDLERPFETDNISLQLLTFEDSDEGKEVFWHSTAHVLGEAMERVYGGLLCYGPPIESGFYYDMFMNRVLNEGTEHEQRGVSTNDFPVMQSLMAKISKERQPFERLELTKDQLIQMFSYNQFKVRILNEKIPEERTTVYRCGSLIDLCRGPHVRHTGYCESATLTKTSSSYWEGKTEAEPLTRVYGISFPNKKQLKDWQTMMAEAAKRDHRKLGREQDLFFFHELSPGSCFFAPKGAFIYNTLVEFLRLEYRKRGFQEVISPNVYNARLWKTSGHWDHYAENMFSFESEKETFALKPMNCPGHCLIFDSTVRSWRDLPLRLADFGVLHRNELSGALSGLTRVRRFQQDDAHIFCRSDQVKDEVRAALGFLNDVYTIFGFTFDLVLSTRPEKYLGEICEWNEAEAALSQALNDSGHQWSLNPGDGAFYGPKIDITIKDALKRTWQCATIQLDFQLPQRFGLKYSADDGTRKTPVIIHRAVLGSLERFIAIITENFGGKWPFWLSPRQAVVLPVSDAVNDYALSVRDAIHSSGFMVDLELDAGLTIQKKVRNAQLAQYNFILVVGKQEEDNKSVNVRTRDNVVHGEISVEELIAKFKKFVETKTLTAGEDFAEGRPPVSQGKKKQEQEVIKDGVEKLEVN